MLRNGEAERRRRTRATRHRSDRPREPAAARGRGRSPSSSRARAGTRRPSRTWPRTPLHVLGDGLQGLTPAAVLAVVEPWLPVPLVALAAPYGFFPWRTAAQRYGQETRDTARRRWGRHFVQLRTRALARPAPLLVLDEPTASLDVRAEEELFRRFRELAAGRTAIFVSHRFSTVATADRVVVLSDGRIADSGPHEELLARGGLYAELYRLSERMRSLRV